MSSEEDTWVKRRGGDSLNGAIPAKLKLHSNTILMLGLKVKRF